MIPPKALVDRKQWLVWRLEKDPKRPEKKKLLKVPYYVDNGRRYGDQGSDRDRRRLAVHEAALKAAPVPGLEVGNGGIGFAFLPGDGLIGIDLDNALEANADGEILPKALTAQIIAKCDSYTEYSPSGKGVHIYLAGESRTNKFDGIGVELFCGSQYFTVTGKHYPGTPLEVRPMRAEVLEWLHAMIDGAKEEAKKAKAAARAAPASAQSPAPVASLDNDFKRVNDAAMANLGAWVPALLPAARPYQDGYRVSSADLGRDLDEDLSILPKGIVDWGVNDQGDAREGRRTPIDLVIEWSPSAKKAAEALHWLAEKLGIALEQRGRRKRGAGSSGEPPAGDDGGAATGRDERPTIKWTQGKLPECVDQAEDALLRSGLRIYQRAGFLVRVVRRDTPSVRYYKRPPGALGLHTVDAPYLIEAFTRAARWLKWSSQKSDWVPTNAPEQAATTYIARRGHWQLPRLWSAISAPTLRPDGTVLQEPGYDATTQSWYDPCGIDFPKIPDAPTREDAEASLKKLRAAFGSFPFESEADRAVAHALVLTALVRRSLPSAPLGAITAPVMASGKTLLADCIAILATGISAPAMKYADTDEEATKTMLAVLAEGDQVVLIDNIERPLEGDTLCAVLTAESYRQRVLGRTEMMSVPTTTLFLATGNHLVIAGDLRTRALLCRIDPKVERPEERQFNTELRTWMTEKRPELVAAGLTIMRAFISTKQEVKDFCPTWGRFERWSDMVRAPLLWLGCADPCATLKELEKEDPDRIELAGVLDAWERVFRHKVEQGDKGHTARDAITIASSARDAPPDMDPSGQALYLVLREICRDRRDGTLDARRLSSWLRKHADRLVDGKRFVRAGEFEHTLLWKVEVMKKQA
jgi:hypothetical protein